MELCTARGTSNLPLLRTNHFATSHIRLQCILRCNAHFPFRKQTRFNSGLQYRRSSSLRSTASEETSTVSTDTTPYVKDEAKPAGEITIEDSQPVEKKEDCNQPVEKVESYSQPVETKEAYGQPVEKVESYSQPVETKEGYDSQLNEASQGGQSIDILLQLKFLEDLGIKFDDKNSILVYGGGGALALWLVATIIRAVDSVPLLPKVMELVGIGYSIWFTYSYLIFKETRDELFARVGKIKEEVLD